MNIWITYYSIGALILSFFNIFIIISSLRRKTTKFYTQVLNNFFIFFLPTNLSYLVASIYHNPLMAYYRWFTVPSVFISYSYLTFFILIFKEEKDTYKYKIKRLVFILLFLFSLITTLFFYIKTFNQKIVYVFSGHNYELFVPEVNKTIFNFLIGMLILMFLSVIYKTVSLVYKSFINKDLKEDKKTVYISIILIWLLFLTQLIPTLTNILSANRIIDRGFHYLIFVIIIVLGFSAILFLYINLEKEESSILYKINSISIITLLLITQIITYLTMKDVEANFVKMYQTKYENLLVDFDSKLINQLSEKERPIFILNDLDKNFIYIDEKFKNNQEILNYIINLEKSEKKTFYYQHEQLLLLRFALSNNKIVYSSYFLLRSFLHSYSNKIFFLLLIFVLITSTLFPFFYKIEIVKSIEELIYKIQKIELTNDFSIKVEKFYNDELGIITDTFNKMIFDLKISYQKLLEYSKELETKVQSRTEELNEQIEIIKKLKEQQEGDYFLTSLLTKALIKKEIKEKTNIQIDTFLKQAKDFQFKNRRGNIGGDNIILDKVYLYNISKKKVETYIFGAISDALGSSMQGAFGSIVFSVVVFSFLKALKKKILIENEIAVLQECYYLLQRIFLSFNGEMTCSAVLFAINETSGEISYVNLDFPNVVVANSLKKGELIELKVREDNKMPLIGIEHNKKIKIHRTILNENEKIVIYSDGVNYLEFFLDDKKYNFFDFIKALKLNFKEIFIQIENHTLKDDVSIVIIEKKRHDDHKSLIDKDLFFTSLLLVRKGKIDLLGSLLTKLEKNNIFGLDVLCCFVIFYYFKNNYKISRTILEFILINAYKDLEYRKLIVLLNLYTKICYKINYFDEISKNIFIVIFFYLSEKVNQKESLYIRSLIKIYKKIFKSAPFNDLEKETISKILNDLLTKNITA